MKKIGGSGFSGLGNSLRLVESIIARTRALSLRHARLLKCKLRKWRSGQVLGTEVLNDKILSQTPHSKSFDSNGSETESESTINNEEIKKSNSFKN